MTLLQWDAEIANNKIEHRTYSTELAKKFYADNNGKSAVVSVEIIEDKVRHHQHKFYRGILLPAISKHLNGVSDTSSCNELHEQMKRQFCSIKIKELSDVLEHHTRNTIVCVETIRHGEVQIIPDYYIPSTGDFTKIEMADFINEVWMFACTELDVGFDHNTVKSYNDYIDTMAVHNVATVFSGKQVADSRDRLFGAQNDKD